MSYSLSHQGQTVNNFPVSLISEAEGGGALGSAGITIALAIPTGNVYRFNPDDAPAAAVDVVTVGGTESPQPLYELILDLTGMSEGRMIANVTSVGNTNNYLELRYSTDNATFHEMVTGGFTIVTDTLGWQDTGWQTLVAGSLATIYLHPFSANGDSLQNFVANLQPFYLQFR